MVSINCKKVFIIATEPSGDLIGYELIKKLKFLNRNISIIGIGGEKMNSLEFNSILPTDKMNVNGLIEVLFRLNDFLFFLRQTKLKIKEYNPDIIITIDSPSFNYRIINQVQYLRPKTKLVHIVAPTVWAWKKYRAKQFAEKYDLLLTLFDFEPKYFQQYNKNVFCIGHPIFFNKKKKKLEKKKK